MVCSQCNRDGIITNGICAACTYVNIRQSRAMDAHDLVARLSYGQVLEHKNLKNSDGTPQRFKITSLKTWKKDRMRVRIGLKRGLYQNESIDSMAEFFQHFNLTESK